TFLGRRRLAALLTSPPESMPKIIQRQQAVGELAQNFKWRQWLAAFGSVIEGKIQDPHDLAEWARERNSFYAQKTVIWGARALSAFTVGTLIIFLETHKIPFYLPFGALFLQYILLKIHGKDRKRLLDTVFYYRKNLELYQELLFHIEQKNFSTEYLGDLKRKLQNHREELGSVQLRRLVKIADQVATRDHALYGIFNTLTLWDYHCLITLETWKENSGQCLGNWLETIGEFEALASLATLNYDHPDWVVPQITEGPSTYIAKGLGHPLLPAAFRKGNDLEIQNRVQVLLITGSNMSGKSTYLRTTGINLVLAYAGAPVCAQSFICSRMSIYTCMRVSDNLEKNISTFYAEILRIKMIVEATSASQKAAFFLLDEIFKGTNSIDRHLGAKVLIKKLIQQQAVGLVSTHDLELGELEQECSQVKNYHFQEFFRDGQLAFDYVLRPGISKTRNALYLMKAAGIEVEEKN
ncbi:MAG TPA: DNA mismatch repair protein, partial [Firmicutes bacterium]|nr:DNA mismatch repair protein [Bacillota bacterium]